MMLLSTNRSHDAIDNERDTKIMATITPKEFAARVNSDGRTVRKFLRSAEGMNAKVGKGQRWTIEAKQVASLTKRFNRWLEAKSPATDEAPDEG